MAFLYDSPVLTQLMKKWETLLAGAALLLIAVSLAARNPLPLQMLTVLGGAPLLLTISRKIIKGDFGADMLAALALVTAAVMGQWMAAALIVLMLSGGQALESFAARKASSVLTALARRMPSSARRRRPGGTEQIDISAIAPGDLLEVLPHETCPVDGTVTEGHGTMDEAYLTGEPYRISKAPGASVLSGAVNGATMLVVRADRLPEDSRYARITAVMREAEQKRPALRRMGDRIGAVFTPLAVTAALLAWAFSGDAMRFLAVLVVATPCPLLIAIPVTIISAISMAAKRGIIIRDPVVLERLPGCTTAIFDKTGTLTYGTPELTDIVTANGFTAEHVLQLAASAEVYSKHPLAEAVSRHALKNGINVITASGISENPGQGLTAHIGEHTVHVTHRRKLLHTSPAEAALLPEAPHGLECIVMVDGKAAAAFRFHDTPRREGQSFIRHLGPVHGFKKTMIISGDRSGEVDYLASLLGISATYASQTPEQKLEIVRREAADAPTVFMGDGINDAPALAAATVGLAFGAGSVAGEAAGAVILESSLAKVDELIHISARMRRIALQSAIGGMFLSLCAMGLAAAGLLPPVKGALLQEAIDVLAILNALRLSLQGRVDSDIR